MKSDFLATVSRELRTPLTVIKGTGLTLDRMWDDIDDPTRRDLVAALNANTGSLEQVITNLLDFSRLDAGQLAPEFDRVDLSDLLRGTARRLGPLFAERAIRVDVEPSLAAFVDPVVIDRAVENLLTNALFGAGDPAPDASVLDPRGRSEQLSTSWSDRPAVLVFLRYFGCPLCQQQVATLRADEDRFAEADTNVVLVGQGRPSDAERFVEEKSLPSSCGSFSASRTYPRGRSAGPELRGGRQPKWGMVGEVVARFGRADALSLLTRIPVLSDTRRGSCRDCGARWAQDGSVQRDVRPLTLPNVVGIIRPRAVTPNVAR